MFTAKNTKPAKKIRGGEGREEGRDGKWSMADGRWAEGCNQDIGNICIMRGGRIRQAKGEGSIHM
jgi:hypothetical protein